MSRAVNVSTDPDEIVYRRPADCSPERWAFVCRQADEYFTEHVAALSDPRHITNAELTAEARRRAAVLVDRADKLDQVTAG